MTLRRNLLPDEVNLWRRVAKTTKAYRQLAEEALSEALAAIQQPQVVPSPRAPELPHLALKRAKAARMVSQKADIKPPIKPVRHLLADAAGHKKVRRGKLEIDARIDLHGMRQIQAQTALADIIARTRSLNGRCILVVTGKGQPVDPGEDYITPQPGVIRRRFPEWLHGPGVHEHVSGFASAHPKDGGSGAFYVLLKSNKLK